MQIDHQRIIIETAFKIHLAKEPEGVQQNDFFQSKGPFTLITILESTIIAALNFQAL